MTGARQPRKKPRGSGQEYARTLPATPFYPEQVSTLLPASIRTALVQAAKVDRPRLVWGESKDRAQALETVLRRVKLHHPEFFRQPKKETLA